MYSDKTYVHVHTENVDDPLHVNIAGEFISRHYVVSQNGHLQMGLKLSKLMDYVPGLYNVTASVNGTVYASSIIGLDVLPPIFTLHSEYNIYYPNEYAHFFGQVIGIETDYTVGNSVLVEILDSDGNLLEDNWTQGNYVSARDDTSKDATYSKFRSIIHSDDLYLVGESDDFLEERKYPSLEYGYRFYIKTVPTIYDVGETYTVKVSYDDLVRTMDFIVTDYRISAKTSGPQ